MLGRFGRHPFRNPFLLFLKVAEREEDGVSIAELEPGKDDVEVADLVPEELLEEEPRSSD